MNLSTFCLAISIMSALFALVMLVLLIAMHTLDVVIFAAMGVGVVSALDSYLKYKSRS